MWTPSIVKCFTLNHAHYLHIAVWIPMNFPSRRHTPPCASHSCVRFHKCIQQRFTQIPCVYQHTTTCWSYSEQHCCSWDAIQTLILNTMEQRWCFTNKMLSTWGRPDSRASDIRGPCWTSSVPCGFLAHTQGRHRRLKPTQNTLGSGQAPPHSPGGKGRSADTAGPMKVLCLVIC